MEKYKIENLQKNSINELQFETLDSDQSTAVLKSLSQELNINIGNLYATVNDKLKTLCSITNINENTGFSNILKALDIDLPETEKFYMIWDEQNVDVFSVSDLKKYWDHIWYGEADEALILFIPRKLVFMIHDWGEIKVHED